MKLVYCVNSCIFSFVIMFCAYLLPVFWHQWFCRYEKFEDELDKQKTIKFRADLKYRKKHYEVSHCYANEQICFMSCEFCPSLHSMVSEYLQDAIEDYIACLPLVPNNNLSMKRDVLEGIARCYSHLGKHRQALEICEKLVGYNISCVSDVLQVLRKCLLSFRVQS